MFYGVFLFIMGGAPSLSSAADNYVPDNDVLSEFDVLQLHISDTPRTELSKGLNNSLSKQLNAAEKAYKRGKGCTAANILGAYLNHTNALIRGKGVAVAENLRNRGSILQNNLLLRF